VKEDAEWIIMSNLVKTAIVSIFVTAILIVGLAITSIYFTFYMNRSFSFALINSVAFEVSDFW